MPFTVSPSSYRGGDYIFQGISNATQGLTGAINQWQQVAQQADQSDALMKYLSQQNDPTTGKPIVDAKALEAYQNHSMRQRAAVAGAMSVGMPLVQSLQHYANANRETAARTNLLQAQAAELNAPFTPGATTVQTQQGPRTVVSTSRKSAQLVPQQAGNPGEAIFDPNTKKAVGFYGNDGKPIFYQHGQSGLDLTGLFGGGGATPVDPNAAAVPAPGGDTTGATDQAYSAQGNPSNTPAYLLRPPAAQAQTAAPSTGATRGAPQAGERRFIQGQLAEWDGTGWKAVGNN